MPRKFYSIFLLIACILPFFYVSIFRMERSRIRHKMKERLEQESLQIVRVPKNEIRWVKPGKEILLNGRMFDIKSIQLQEGNYIIHGLYDDEETDLVHKWEKTQRTASQHGNLALIQFIKLFQFSSGSQIKCESPVLVLENLNKYDKPTTLQECCISVPTPPPIAISCA